MGCRSSLLDSGPAPSRRWLASPGRPAGATVASRPGAAAARWCAPVNPSPATAAASRLMQTRLRLQQALGVAAADTSSSDGNGSHGRDHGPDVSRSGSRSDLGHTDVAQTGSAPLSGLPGGPALADAPSHASTHPSTAFVSPGPAARLLARLRAGWAHHPLHSVGTLALLAANAAARPVAQRHPFALLLAAAACGAALAWVKPWRGANPRLPATAAAPTWWPGLLPSLLTALMPAMLAALSPTSIRASKSWWPHLVRALLDAAPRPVQQSAAKANPRRSASSAD